MKMTYRKGVFIATYRREGEKILYLVLKRKLHWKGWEFPKGGVERGEDIKRGVRRELKEETGQKPLKIKEFRICGKYKYDREYPDRKNLNGQTYKLFSAEIKNKGIRFDRREHSSYKWLKFEKARNLLTWPNQRKCLGIVNRRLK